MFSQIEEPSLGELAYISAMSRNQVVSAYTSWKAISEAEQRCIEFVRPEGKRILDLGCGAGRFANFIGEKAEKYLGVDASKEMIEAAQINYSSLAFFNSDIVGFDAGVMEWDIILLMGNVLDYLKPFSRRSAVFANCAKWLGAGGQIIGSCHLTQGEQDCGYYCEDYHGTSVENYRASLPEIIHEVESCGFEVMLSCRDYRKQPADWCYWVAKKIVEIA